MDKMFIMHWSGCSLEMASYWLQRCNNLNQMPQYESLNRIYFFLRLLCLLSYAREPRNGLWPQHDRRGVMPCLGNVSNAMWTDMNQISNLCVSMRGANTDLQLIPHGCQTESSTFPLPCCVTWPTSDVLLCSTSQVKLLFLARATRCQNRTDVAPTSLVCLFQRGYASSVCSGQIHWDLYNLEMWSILIFFFF